MNVDEIIEKFFMQDFIDANSSKMKEILSHVKKFTKDFKISVRKTDIDDAIKKKKDNNYKVDCEIKLLDDGIELPFPCSAFLEELKKHIPTTVEKVSLPISMYTDLPNFFTRFSNLKTIGISNYGKFDREELDQIYKYSNVTDIEDSSMYFGELPSGLNSITADYEMIECKYKNINIHIKNNKIDSIDSINSIKNITIVSDNIDYNQILEMMSKYSNVKDFEIKCPNNMGYKIRVDNKEIQLDIDNNNPKAIVDFYNYFQQHNYDISRITFSINNSEKNYYDIDYAELDKLSKKINLEARYSIIEKGSYEQFRTMIEGIKWYRNIINESNLSPVEKVAMAYDIMKTFQYKEVNDDEDKSISRNPNTIMETGNIVCVGYTSMLQEVFKYLDNNIKIDNFGVTCYDEEDKFRGYHSRSIVRIDDDKYNIHGIYALDATWDSIKRNGKEVFGNDYDALSLYHYFLVPIHEYKKTFKYDSTPKLFDNNLKSFNDGISKNDLESQINLVDGLKEKNNLVKEDLSDFDSVIINLFGKDTSKKQIFEYLNARKISFEEILSIVYNTRKAEGYSGEYLENEIEKIRRINSRYYGIDVNLEEENGKQI